MEQPSLKVELIDGLQVIRCRKEDFSWEDGKALAICIPDFRGQTGDPIRNVILIEWFDGMLQLRVYDGGEDSSDALALKPDPVLTHALHCPLTELPKLLSSEDGAVKEIVEQRLNENK